MLGFRTGAFDSGARSEVFYKLLEPASIIYALIRYPELRNELDMTSFNPETWIPDGDKALYAGMKEIDTGEAMETGQGETEIKLPSRNRWQIDSPGVEISWPSVNKVVVRWSGSPGPYLLRSYFVPCKAGQTVLLPVNCHVRSGVLGIGVLSGKTAGWIKAFEFKKGESLEVFEFNTGHDSQIQIVLYSNGADKLDAEVDWIDAIQEESSDPAFETGKTQDGRMTFPRIKKFFFGATRYYCQSCSSPPATIPASLASGTWVWPRLTRRTNAASTTSTASSGI